MERLEDVSLPELQRLRAETEGEIPRERVLVAIGRKQGDSIERLAERHGVVEKTVRNWLDRFADRPLEQAPYDEPRPGRPPKLSETQRQELFEALGEPPSEVGLEAESWSPKLVGRFIESTFGVEYTERHVRQLLREGETA